MKKFDITIAGEINLDLILEGLPVDLPCERELLASGFAMTLGSSSAILAHNLAALGMAVGFTTMVGRDALGAIALERLAESGVDLTRLVQAKDGVNTGVTVLLTHPGKRHMFTYPGTISELTVRDLDLEYLKSSRHFHLSSLFLQKGLQPGLAALFGELKQAGLTISLDTNDDPDDRWESGLEQLLPLVDVLMPNDDEACRMTRCSKVEEAAAKLAAAAPLVVIKCGGRGTLVRSGDETWMAPAFEVQPVDTIGAGDTFNAGFLRAYLRGSHPVACALAGNRAAAFSTLKAGGTEAFRDRGALRDFFATAKVRSADGLESTEAGASVV